ncbi:MAG: hypothetical protein WC619_02670 [Patescibacteria group bacterium]
MKRIATMISVPIMVLLMVGCASMRSATVSTSGSSISFKEKNFSLLSPSINPYEMAELIDAQARAEYMKNLVNKTGSGKKLGNYLIAIINNDPSQEAYFFNPEIPGSRITLKPNGGFFFLSVQTIPAEIALYRKNGGNAEIFYKLYPLDDMSVGRYNDSVGYKKSVMGVEVDQRYIINKIY